MPASLLLMIRVDRPTGRKKRRLSAIAGFLLTAALAVFHARLFWERLSEGSLLEPGVALRWFLSALLVLAMLSAWSRGLSLLRGRRAAVLWLVAFLLHAGVPGGSLPAIEPGTSTLLLPVVLAALAALGVRGGLRSAGLPSDGRRFALRRRRAPVRRRAGWSANLFSRPPPAALHP